MSKFTKFASVAVLAASLAPFAAQARSGDLGTTGPAQHLVRTGAADQTALRGRQAENAKVPAGFTTAPGDVQYANGANSADDGSAS